MNTDELRVEPWATALANHCAARPCANQHDDFRAGWNAFAAYRLTRLAALEAERDKAVARVARLEVFASVTAEWTGEGGPHTPWQEIVRRIGNQARTALAQQEPGSPMETMAFGAVKAAHAIRKMKGRP